MLQRLPRVRQHRPRRDDPIDARNLARRFNGAPRGDHDIRDLFAHDLGYDVHGLPEQNYAQLCQRLHIALYCDRSQSYHYDLHIKEIIVSGDLAIVWLTWTETATAKRPSMEVQPGLDVFGMQSDGGWKIIRHTSFVAKDEKLDDPRRSRGADRRPASSAACTSSPSSSYFPGRSPARLSRLHRSRS